MSGNAWSVLCAIVEQHALHNHTFMAMAFERSTLTELRDLGCIHVFSTRGCEFVHFSAVGLHEYNVVN